MRFQSLSLLFLVVLAGAQGSELKSLVFQPGSDRYVQRSWTRADGLPDDEINDLLQTRDGYLWAATRSGLARFDGFRFVVFDHANTPSMSDPNCLGLAEDIEGGLWVLTKETLLRWHRQRWQTYPLREVAQTKRVLRIKPDLWQVGLWICTDQGLRRWTKNGFEWVDIPGIDSEQPVYSVCQSAETVLWLGVGDQLVRYDLENALVRTYVNPHTRFHCVVEDIQLGSEGTLWCLVAPYASKSGTLYQFREGQWRVERARAMFNSMTRAVFTIIRSGTPCFPSWLDFDSYLEKGIPKSGMSKANLSGLAVMCLMEDRDGSIWLGTERNGLHRLSPSRFGVVSELDGLAGHDAWAILESSNGKVWVGTDQGTTCLDDDTTIAGEPYEQDVRALSEDGQGRLWIGTSNGLNVWAPGQVHHYHFAGEWERTKVRALAAGPQDLLWVGTARGLRAVGTESLPAFLPWESGHSAQPSTAMIQPILTVTNGLTDRDVRSLLLDHENGLWIGTTGAGLHYLRDGRVSQFTTADGLPSDSVWALYQDDHRNLWIGTDRGLACRRGSDLLTFTTAHGLPDNLVNCIVEDRAGSLWIGHDRGLYQVNKMELWEVAEGRARKAHCVPYNEVDGLPIAETNGQRNQPAGIRTRDGRVWFATPKGVAIVDPQNLPPKPHPPPALIERIQANGVVLYGENQLRNTPTARLRFAVEALTEKTIIPPGQARYLELSYTAINFAAPEQVRFKHRLVGLDSDWTDAGPNRVASYANIPPGQYRFEVQAMDKFGQWSLAPAVFTFRLQPYFHQTSTFLFGGTCLVVGLAVGLHRWRLRYTRRIHKLEQERALARDRARVLKDLHDGLGAQLTMLSLVAQRSDPKTAQLAREITSQLKHIIWVNHPMDQTLEGLIDRICMDAQELLTAAKVACRLDLPEDVPPFEISPEFRHHLLMASREAAANIARHARASETRIRIDCSPTQLRLEYRDNGTGFDPKVARNGGHGLRNLRERLTALAGDLVVESRPGAGTTLEMSVPLLTLQQPDANR